MFMNIYVHIYYLVPKEDIFFLSCYYEKSQHKYLLVVKYNKKTNIFLSKYSQITRVHAEEKRGKH